MTIFFLEKPAAVLTGLVSRGEEQGQDGVVWRRLKYRYLRWTDYASRLLMSGMRADRILNPRFILLDGAHRPPYHPAPGMDHVELAEIIENLNGLSPVELFIRIK